MIFFAICMSFISCGSQSAGESVSHALFPLNDTGAGYCRALTGEDSQCSSAPSQDGNTGRDVMLGLAKVGSGLGGFDFTRLNVDGSQSSGSDWGCIRDNHTGLLWEVKSDDATQLNHKDWLYQWFDANANKNGGYSGEPASVSGSCGLSSCNTSSFVAAMNSAHYCGVSDWRLPTVNEFMSLVVSDHLALAIDTDYFPYTQSSHYWASQSYAPKNTHAWYLYFSDGSTSSTLKSKPMYLRLVSSGGKE